MASIALRTMSADDPSTNELSETMVPVEPALTPWSSPVDVRNLSLAVLAILASIFTLHWASDFFIPVMAGLLLSYALSPMVDWLQRYRIPRAISAATLLLSILGGVGSLGYWLSDDASKLVELLPAAAHKLRSSMHALPGSPDNTLVTVQKAAIQLEQAADESTRATPVARGVQRVQIEKPRFDVKDHLWTGTLGLVAMVGQIGMVVLIAFFLMASGDSFRRKVIKLAGPTLGRKRITLQALNQIHDHIQRYMLVQLFTSALVGLATWLCFLAIGVEQAAVWGIAAGILDLIPYVGSVTITGSAMLISFLQFGEASTVLLVGGVSVMIHVGEAFLLTPWLTSRANKMNPFAIFIGVMAWGWIWGVWGLLLGVPILVMIKAVCDRVEDLKPIGEFLGD